MCVKELRNIKDGAPTSGSFVDRAGNVFVSIYIFSTVVCGGFGNQIL